MPTPVIDPSELARIQAHQAYQQKLDTYNYAEERRLARKANFGKQSIFGLITLILVAIPIGSMLISMPTLFSAPFLYAILGFFLFTEILLVMAFLASLIPSAKPVAAKFGKEKDSY